MPGHLVRGHRAAGRYRLESELGAGVLTRTWRAVDETLERPVALHFFDRQQDRAALVERAGLAASLTHPRVVRLFDTGFDGGQFFTVTELLPGSLAWARTPLPSRDVAGIGAQIAEALDYAHRRGVTHGAVHEGNVLLSEQGAKLAGFGLSARVVSGPAPARPEDDLVALGKVLQRALGTSEPARTPDACARIAAGLAAGEYPDARSARSALVALAADSAPAPRRRWRIVVAALALLAVAVVAGVGLRLLGSRNPPEPRPTPPPRIDGPPLRIERVDDFDPLGDRAERGETAARAIDGNSTTFWTTETYRGSARFNGRKPGVGLILDLGRERAAGAVRVRFAAAGCSYELRAAPAKAPTLDGWVVVLDERRAGTLDVGELEAHTSRWWLLWITALTKGIPGAGSTWSCGVNDVGLYPP